MSKSSSYLVVDTPKQVHVSIRSSAIVQELNVRIPMRDGVTLSADIYRPVTTEPVPSVLIRTPYTKASELAPLSTASNSGTYGEQGRWWVEHGYAFVVQDVRGRGDSDGIFYPLVNEAADGFDTLTWLGERSWSTGRIGMIGSSYLGWVQVYAAGELNPYLKAIVPAVTPPDPDRHFPLRYGAAFLQGAAWLAGIDGHTPQNPLPTDITEIAYQGLPLVMLDARLGRNLPAWRDWVTHPPGDSYWLAQSYQDKLRRSKIPMLHVTGWYDTVATGTTENFLNMSQGADSQARACQRMLIGPWMHHVSASRQLGSIDFGQQAIIDFRSVQRRWFDHWLVGLDNGVDREPRVRLFVMGANRWMNEDEWPIARTTFVKYYLHSRGKANTRWGDGQLGLTIPTAECADRFRYDPRDPVPFVRDEALAELGPHDFRSVETRPDVLVYTSEPMTEPTLVCGPLRVKLFAASSAVDTDWTARVLNVWPDGFAQQLSYGIVRSRYRCYGKQELLKPHEAYEYDIDVWATCVELQPGHRVRLEISSSAFPWFDRNLNTGDKPGMGTESVVAEQTVLHGGRQASYLLLPIVPQRSQL